MTPGANSTIIDWQADKLAQFGAVPLQFQHRLHDHALFSEAALTKLLDRLDRRDYYVNTMDVNSHNSRSRREGEIRDLSGAQVLEAVKRGRIWILLLHPARVEPAYGELLQQIYAEVGHTVAGFNANFQKMTVLISSPNIQVYYHCDIPGQTLWQVRGHKRVFVYPNTAPFLEQAALEKIALGEAHEISLPYDPQFDAHASVFELHPGQMLHWPLNAPHRIVNGDCVNVSFTTEHFTPGIRRSFYVNYANGILRHSLGFQHLAQRTSGPSYWAKLGLAAAYKLAGKQHQHRKVLRVDFAVDPNAPLGVRDITPYEMAR